ncbi:hypothetical protein BU23DRAFT_562984 [Bimuria novae-zelandiae CBS 107.79]|uniref:Uncharacterized protein n=1 Tax=Bimuria novae-zelandiae CBS 107.79 TaxID=1447943 RepID=A0A6A5VV12_9PLEO|nr:hypothetical protein BU23DRAFT_562984 [Bimuria novae-zelandiae CBS 107.79]
MSSGPSSTASRPTRRRFDSDEEIVFGNPYAYGGYFDNYNRDNVSEIEEQEGVGSERSFSLISEVEAETSGTSTDGGSNKDGMSGYGGYSDAAREGYFAGDYWAESSEVSDSSDDSISTRTVAGSRRRWRSRVRPIDTDRSRFSIDSDSDSSMDTS